MRGLMIITPKNLDTPFSELNGDATNRETPREFIRNSEQEFGMERADIENMGTQVLSEYVEFLDFLWTK